MMKLDDDKYWKYQGSRDGKVLGDAEGHVIVKFDDAGLLVILRVE